MKPIDCDRIRDMLPLHAQQDIDPATRLAVHEHMAACADCRAEAALVDLLRDAFEPLPAGLEARVLRAVDAARRPIFTRGRLAMAATLAAAVLGGSALLSRATGPEVTRTVAAAGDSDFIAWETEVDPLLHGGSTLQRLSVEELEMLLVELDR